MSAIEDSLLKYTDHLHRRLTSKIYWPSQYRYMYKINSNNTNAKDEFKVKYEGY